MEKTYITCRARVLRAPIPHARRAAPVRPAGPATRPRPSSPGARPNIWKRTWLLRLRPSRPAAALPTAMPPRCMRMPTTPCARHGRVADGKPRPADRRQRRFPPPAGIAADRREDRAPPPLRRCCSRKASASRCATSSASIATNRRLRALRDIVRAFATLVARAARHHHRPCRLGASAERRAAPAASRPPDRGRLRQRQHQRSGSNPTCSAAWSSGSAPAFTTPV